MTATEIIMEVLTRHKGQYLAVFEITAAARKYNWFISDTAASARLRLDLKGVVFGRYREKTKYKEWQIPVSPPVPVDTPETGPGTLPGPSGAAL